MAKFKLSARLANVPAIKPDRRYLAVSCRGRAWGKGKTIEQAVEVCLRNSGRGTRQCDVTWVYDAPADGRLSHDGLMLESATATAGDGDWFRELLGPKPGTAHGAVVEDESFHGALDKVVEAIHLHALDPVLSLSTRSLEMGKDQIVTAALVRLAEQIETVRRLVVDLSNLIKEAEAK